jgi:hypothetical protein
VTLALQPGKEAADLGEPVVLGDEGETVAVLLAVMENVRLVRAR